MPVNPVGIGLYPPAEQSAPGLSPAILPAAMLAMIQNPTITSGAGFRSWAPGMFVTERTYDRSQVQTALSVPQSLTDTPPAGVLYYPVLVCLNIKLPNGGTYSGSITWSVFYEAIPGQALFTMSNAGGSITGTATTRRSATPSAGGYSAFSQVSFQQSPLGAGPPSFVGSRLMVRGNADVTGGDAGDLFTFTAVNAVIPFQP